MTEIIKKTNDLFDDLLLKIQKERSYEIIEEVLGEEIYNALRKKNIFNILKEEENLFYKQNKSEIEEYVLKLFNELKDFSFAKIQKDLIFIKNDFIKKLIEKEYTKEESLKTYYKLISDIRKRLINMLLNNYISIEELKELNDTANTIYTSFLQEKELFEEFE